MKHGYYWLSWGLVALLLVCALLAQHQISQALFFALLYSAAVLSGTTLACWHAGVK